MIFSTWRLNIAFARSSDTHVKLRDKLAQSDEAILEDFGTRKMTAAKTHDLCVPLNERCIEGPPRSPRRTSGSVLEICRAAIPTGTIEREASSLGKALPRGAATEYISFGKVGDRSKYKASYLAIARFKEQMEQDEGSGSAAVTRCGRTLLSRDLRRGFPVCPQVRSRRRQSSSLRGQRKPSFNVL